MSTAPRNVTKPKTLLELGPHDCRWPIGEPRHPDFRFCGARQAADRPYCELHWSMAFQPPKPRHQRPGAVQPAIAVPPATAKAA
jgi:GcrA cell cycle regulator